MSIVLYSASAGSGKTYTLTLEYIQLAIAENEPRGYFRRILAVTFTIKAAEEMRSRILEYLTGISEYPSFSSFGPSQQKEYLEIILSIQQGLKKSGVEIDLNEISRRASRAIQQILQDYGLFSVMTIDSFVQRLSSSFIEELNLPNQFEVILDINNLISSLIDQLLEKVNKAGDPQLTNLMLYFANTEVLEGRNWNLIRKSLHDFFKICFQEDFLKVQNHINSFSIANFLQIEQQIISSTAAILKELAEMALQITQLVDTTNAVDENFANGKNGPISYFRKFSLNPFFEIKNFNYLSKAITSHKWHAANLMSDIESQIKNISDELTIRASEFLSLYEENLPKYLLFGIIRKDIKKIALLASVSEELEIYQNENSAVSISEFSKRIYEVISKDPVPFIYEKLGDRYFHILIDEFQDTSILQWQNFMPLLENTVSMNKLNLLVGDAKQSIYKFRGGEVSLITSLSSKDIQFLGDKLGDNPLDIERFNYLIPITELKNLPHNYRSASEIVHFNNSFFDFVANQPEFQLNSRFLHPIYGKDLIQNPTILAEKCIGLVDYFIFNKWPNSVDPDDENNWMLDVSDRLIQESLQKGFQFKDIAILTRKNKYSKFLALKLKEKGYPIISSDSLLVHYSPIIGFIQSALSLLHDFKNQFLYQEVIFHYLKLVNQTHTFSKENINHPDDLIIDFIDFFKIRNIEINNDSLRQENIISLVYYLIDVFKLESHEEGVDYLFKYLDILHEFAGNQDSTLPSFLNYYDLNKSSFTLSTPEHLDAITITSIHKSKGLEYPVVILPFASWTHQTSKESIWFELNEDFNELTTENDFILHHFYGKVSSKDLALTAHLNQQALLEKDSIFLDSLNMLYVATTRSKQHLHILIAKPGEDNSSLSKTFFKKSIGECLTQFLSSLDIQTIKLPFQMNEDYSSHTDYFILNGSWSFKFQKANKIDVSVELKSDLSFRLFSSPNIRVGTSKSDLFTLQAQKRDRGDLIHDILAQIKGVEDWRMNYLTKIQGTNPELLDELILFFDHINIQNLFIDQQLIFVEKDILCPDGSVFRPDRVIEQNGKTIIIDFKTGSRRESHVNQMSNYKSLLIEMDYKEPSAILIYLQDLSFVYV